MADDLLPLLRLARTEGVGPIAFAALLERHGGPAVALASLRREGRIVPDKAPILAELAALRALGATVLALGREGYPDALSAVPDAPPVLSVRGRTDHLHRPAVAIVGARNASGNGRRFARTLARELAAARFAVVSGLARGIDTAAHEGALDAGGITVAAIAAGVDVPYPPENGGLMERIAHEGAVVSERPLGAVARAKDFPRRNRVIAGLALGVVVVEAAPASGSLITARLAADYGREVMAVPGVPSDPRHRGTNALLRDGAHLIESAADVLDVLAPLCSRHEPPPVRLTRPSPPPTRPATAATGPLLDRVTEVLGAAPLSVDELIRECDAPAPDVQDALLELELAGRIERHPGNRVSLRVG
jgi:DNA processing protein